MRKICYFLILLLITLGCKKEEVNTSKELQDVIFKGTSSFDKSNNSVDCDNPTANYANITINSDLYRPVVFYVNGIPYTNAIKLEPGSYSLEEFILMNNAGTVDDLSDDIIVQAIPITGAPFALFSSNPLPYGFTVTEFEKIEVPIEVICFEEGEFDEFGFNWFEMTEMTIRKQYFFGELCVANPDDYSGSIYEDLENGLQNKMPAVFKVDVFRNGAFIISYNNEAQLSSGDMTLKVNYPDHGNAADQFTFKLYSMVKVCDGFDYSFVDEWTFNDDAKLNSGDNEVVDFIIGNRDANDEDYVFPQYKTLPNSCDLKVKTYLFGSTLGTFVDLTLTNVNSGYTIENGTYPGWNGNHLVIDYENLFEDQSVQAEVYNSLCINSLPESINLQNKNWQAVNWLINNLDNYPEYEWADLQAAFWLLLDKNPQWDGSALAGVPALSELTWAQQMHDDALDNSQNYFPGNEELAAVIFVINESLKDDQVKLNFSFFEVSQ